MESNSSTAGAVVSTGKENYSLLNPSNFDDTRNFLENLDPNFSIVNLKSFNSPTIIKSKKSAKKSDSRSPNPIRVDSPLLKKKIRERKFVIAKKKSRNEDLNSSAAGVVCEKCKKAIGKSSQCWCLAYQSLRASQEDFFDKRAELSNEIDVEKLNKHNVRDENERIKVNHVGQDTGIDNEGGLEGKDSSENNDEDVELILKRRRDKLLKEARESVPESGSGRVMHLVRAFENLHLIRKADDSGDEESEQVLDEKKGTKWGLPGLQQSTKVSNPQVYLPLYCPSDIFLTSESLSLGSTRSYSLDSSQGSFSFSTRTSARGGRSRRRCLVKPPVKENTRPIDVVLHSDIRAEERAEFDQQVARKISFIEQYRLERERQQKLAEEEEIRRLRKEIVPKAQPMPYFDRPFVPRRSTKHLTIPREPKFHVPQHKKIKCCSSCVDNCDGYNG
ncbi:microtubule-destabilizing protein 60-like isoform X5 [Primulina huaijiensis]|uniref:microtubule-destabilizing protein 60-like isoform X5 n=1 Tax=Primulina huaijiensis TaxID=1492673 RepID=UPI003CC7267D